MSIQEYNSFVLTLTYVRQLQLITDTLCITKLHHTINNVEVISSTAGLPHVHLHNISESLVSVIHDNVNVKCHV